MRGWFGANRLNPSIILYSKQVTAFIDIVVSLWTLHIEWIFRPCWQYNRILGDSSWPPLCRLGSKTESMHFISGDFPTTKDKPWQANQSLCHACPWCLVFLILSQKPILIDNLNIADLTWTSRVAIVLTFIGSFFKLLYFIDINRHIIIQGCFYEEEG